MIPRYVSTVHASLTIRRHKNERIGRYLLVKARKNAGKTRAAFGPESLHLRNTKPESTGASHFPLHSPPPFGDATPWFNPLTLGAQMKRFLLAGVATVALIGAASAADLGIRKAPPMVAPPPPPPFSWTGCFVGAHWGWGWGRKDVNETEFTTDSFRAASGGIDTSGAIFGGQVGCDYQFGFGKGKGVGGPGAWVIGIQFDGAGTDINGFRTDPFAQAFDNAFDAAEFGRIAVKEEFLASLTGRLGITGFGGGFWSQTLWYVRGGVAWTRDRWDLQGAHEFLFGQGVFSPATQDRTGWTVGVGWEWAFLPNWSAFVEWNHYDFGTKHLVTTFCCEDFTDTFESKQRLETVKVGVNWRFNLFGKAPVVARY